MDFQPFHLETECYVEREHLSIHVCMYGPSVHFIYATKGNSIFNSLSHNERKKSQLKLIAERAIKVI